MGLPKGLKSKKLLLVGAGLAAVILIGFFAMKFMTSGGAEMVQEKPRSAPRSAKKISKPRKKEETKSPLFQAMEALKDPFRKEDPKLIELQDKLGRTQKEIEYLKASLQEKKLRQEIREIERSLTKGGQPGEQGQTGCGETAGPFGPEMAAMMQACPCGSFFKEHRLAVLAVFSLVILAFLISQVGGILGIIAFVWTL